jgi:hypothetical protein
MKENIAILSQYCMPTRRQIATAEAGGKPLTSQQKMTRLILPVLATAEAVGKPLASIQKTTRLLLPVLRRPV